MGLDQFGYAGIGDEKEEIAYWRKHNRLHGWMQDLWIDRGKPNAPNEESPMGDFNCIPVRLTLSDLEQLEAHILDKKLPETGGFFFGDDSFNWDDENGKPFEDGDYHYKETDLKFIKDARKAIAEGKEVYYDSWW
jgi:hypothetical protein